MNKLINVAIDAMGGDNSPRKIIDGVELHHKKVKMFFINYLEIKKLLIH